MKPQIYPTTLMPSLESQADITQLGKLTSFSGSYKDLFIYVLANVGLGNVEAEHFLRLHPSI